VGGGAQAAGLKGWELPGEHQNAKTHGVAQAS
jgi:hypothetical protein